METTAGNLQPFALVQGCSGSVLPVCPPPLGLGRFRPEPQTGFGLGADRRILLSPLEALSEYDRSLIRSCLPVSGRNDVHFTAIVE
jgi:hypothetical protein